MDTVDVQNSTNFEYENAASFADINSLINNLPTRTWQAEEPRRHWEMILHCERAIFSAQLPDLPLLSRQARFYWHLYLATVDDNSVYQKHINTAIMTVLHRKLRESKSYMKTILFSEQLVRLRTFNHMPRRNVLRKLDEYLKQQTTLETFCLEGLQLHRSEGLRLLSAISSSRKTMRHLYLWRAFKRKDGPLLAGEDYFQDSASHEDRVPRQDHWFRAISNLEFLTTLSVNYAYIATASGNLLVNLAKSLSVRWQWLQLLCPESDVPGIINPNECVANHGIPDIAWLQARLWAPALKVQFTIIGVPQYDMHKRFYTKHTPIHTFILSSGIDLRFRQPWMIDCTLKNLIHAYSKTLVCLHLELWHQRELLDIHFRKLFPGLPNLEIFEFIGEIQQFGTLCAMCTHIQTCQCNVRRVKLQLQPIVSDGKPDDTWDTKINCLLCCFQKDFEEMGVTFDIRKYPC